MFEYRSQIDEEDVTTPKSSASKVKFEFQFVDEGQDSNSDKGLSFNSSQISAQSSPRNYLAPREDPKVLRLKKAIERQTLYFIVSQATLVSLRRGFSPVQMTSKFLFCLGCLTALSFIETSTAASTLDRYWLQELFGILTAHTIATSTLYLVQVPLAEYVTEVPVLMGYLLQRLLGCTLFISFLHVGRGLNIDKQLSYEEYLSNDTTQAEAELFRSVRIVTLLCLMLFTVYLAFTFVSLLTMCALDGTRVRRPTDFQKFKRVPFGSLLFQEGLDCGMCMKRFRNKQRVVQLECNQAHIFHRACANDWVESGKVQCLYCRARIR